MCNINALFLKKRTPKNLNGFLMATTSNSFTLNKDGEGFYCDYEHKHIKSDNKINYNDFKEINKSKMIITHQRFSTSGFEKKYNHPFISKDFVMVHNGVINQFKKNSGSDSYGFFEEFKKCFEKNIKLGFSREKSLIKSIKELFKEDLGSYSILITDKKTEKSYYFKDSSTKIHFFRNEDYLFITTLKSNDLFLNLLSNKDFVELDIKENTIYRIEKNSSVYSVGFIREVEKKVVKFENKHKKNKKNKNHKPKNQYLTNKELALLKNTRKREYLNPDYYSEENYSEENYSEYDLTNKFLENEIYYN